MIKMTISVEPLYIWCFCIPQHIATRMDETRSEVFKLIQSSLDVQVKPCEEIFWGWTWKDITILQANDVSC